MSSASVKGKGSPNSNKSLATTFHYAARDGKLRVIEDLFAHSSPEIHDINIPTADGSTALHFAAQYGHVEVCEYLVRHRADWTIKTRNGETALDRAIKDNRRRCVKFLEEQIAAAAKARAKEDAKTKAEADGSSTGSTDAKTKTVDRKQTQTHRISGKFSIQMGAGPSVPFV